MQAASDKDGDDFIVVRRKYSGKLADAFGVAALGETDKEPSVDAKDIAAFESSWKRNVFELSKPGKSVSERLSLTTASLRTRQVPDASFSHARRWLGREFLRSATINHKPRMPFRVLGLDLIDVAGVCYLLAPSSPERPFQERGRDGQTHG